MTGPTASLTSSPALEAVAFKAQYTTLLKTTILVFYALTYLDNMCSRHWDKKEAANTKEWTWVLAWSAFVKFDGSNSYNTGAYHDMKKILPEAKDTVQNVIDFNFPLLILISLHNSLYF